MRPGRARVRGLPLCGLRDFHLSPVHLPRRGSLQALPGNGGRYCAGSRLIPGGLAGALTALPRAVIRTPIAPLLAEPSVSATQLTQALRGHIVELIEERDSWRLARGADGYEGWVHRGYLSPCERPLNGSGPSAWNYDHPISLGCVVRGFAGGIHSLPLGAVVPDSVELLTGEVMTLEERRQAFPADSASIIESAKRLFSGTSYVWGGVTPWGADCSGLVQTIYALHGVMLPRDAWQQGGEGGLLEGGLAAVRPGDLLFFSDRDDRRMTHVAISTGSCGIVHQSVARGGFAVESLDSDDPISKVLAGHFLFGRRVLPGNQL